MGLSSLLNFPSSTVGLQLPSVRDGAKKDYQCIITCTDLNIQVSAALPEEFTLDIQSQYEAPFSKVLDNQVGEVIGSAARMIGMSMTNQMLTAQVWQGTQDVDFSLPLVFQAENDELSEVMANVARLMALVLPQEPTEGGLLESPGPRIDLKRLQQAVKTNVGPGAKNQSNNAFGASVGKMMNPLQDTDKSFGEIVSKGGDAAIDGLQTIKEGSNQASARFSRTVQQSIRNAIRLEIGRFMVFPSVVITGLSQTFPVQPLESGNYQRVEVNVSFRTFTLPTNRNLEQMFPSAAATVADAVQGSLPGWVSQEQ